MTEAVLIPLIEFWVRFGPLVTGIVVVLGIIGLIIWGDRNEKRTMNRPLTEAKRGGRADR